MKTGPRSRKLLFGAVIGFLLLLLLALLSPAFIDAHAIKAVLEQKIREQVPRNLKIQNVRLSLWNGIRLLAEGVTIGEDPAYGNESFIEADSLEIRLSFISLLFGRQEPSSVAIANATIRLREGLQGWNFNTLIPPASVAAAGGTTASPEPSDRLPALSVRDSRIVIYPLGATNPWILENLSLSSAESLLSSAYRFRMEGALKLAASSAVVKASGRYRPSARHLADSLEADVSLTGLPLEAVSSLLRSYRSEIKLPPVSGSIQLIGNLKREDQGKPLLSGRLTIDGLKRTDESNETVPFSLYADYVAGLSCNLSDLSRIDRPGTVRSPACSLDIRSLEIASGTTHIHISGGVENLSASPKLALRASSTAAAPKDLLQLAAILRGGAVPSATAGTLSFDFSVEGSPDNPLVKGSLDSPRLSFNYPDLKEPITVSSIHVDLDGERLRTNRFNAGIGDQSLLSISAEAFDLSRDPALNLQVQTTRPMPLQQLMRVGSSFGIRMPARMQVESGSASLDIDARNLRLKSRRFSIRGEAVLENAVLRLAGLNEVTRIPAIRLEMSDGRIQSNHFDVDMGTDGALSAEFLVIDSAAGPEIQAEIRTRRPIHAEHWLEAGRAWGLQVPGNARLKGGQLSCDLKLRSNAGQEPQLAGSLRFEDGEVRSNLAAEPLLIRRLDGELRPGRIELRDIAAHFLDSGFRGSATVRLEPLPNLQLAIQADQVNVNRLMSALGLTQPRNGASQVPRGSDAARAQELPDFAISDSRLGIRHLVYDQLELTHLDTNLTYGRKVLQLAALNFDLYSGKHQGSLRVDLSGTTPEFQYQGRLQSVELRELLSRNTRMVNVLYGRFDSVSALSGRGHTPEAISETLRGNGTYRLTNGRITTFNLGRQISLLTRLAGWNFEGRTTELEEVDGSYRLEGGRIHLDKSRVKTPEAFVICSGSVGMDHSVDLRGTAELSDQWKDPGNLLGQVVAGAASVFFRSEAGKIVVPFHLQGTVEDPAFVLDPETAQKAMSRILRPENIQSGVKAIEDLIRTGRSGSPATTIPQAVPLPGAGSGSTTTTQAPQPADLISGIGGLVGGILGAVQQSQAGAKPIGGSDIPGIMPNVTDLIHELSVLAAMPPIAVPPTERKARIDRLLSLLFAAPSP